ncbi:centromere protein X-like [Nycticebus coucang]|uniref:centromere protein X-like n=1 Tax=Nycticebus coucang TaxID=9470 RepID=UPI00234DD4F8|nr:centromere protein X-like [Nycticebus coucang]
MKGEGAGFQKELVSKLLHLHFEDAKTKVNGDALQLMVELLKIFVVEAAVHGVRQAQAEDVTLMDVDQLEKVLPQLESRGRPTRSRPLVSCGLWFQTGKILRGLEQEDCPPAFSGWCHLPGFAAGHSQCRVLRTGP